VCVNSSRPRTTRKDAMVADAPPTSSSTGLVARAAATMTTAWSSSS
jgi:hypothetical protein